MKIKNIVIDHYKTKLLLDYAELIVTTNRRFNLTGLKEKKDIIHDLIIGSIEPVIGLNVPRGTVFADIGSGAGIPGIPIAIYHEHMTGVLIDSNTKKIAFLNGVIRDLELENIRTCRGRIEELAREQLRETFNYIFIRALGDIHFVVEAGAPLLMQGGFLYLYSHMNPDGMPQSVTEHAQRLGLSINPRNTYSQFGFENTGILMQKIGITDIKYPRKMPIIKRELQRLK